MCIRDSLWATGADVVKLVGMGQRLADCAPVLHLLAGATRPTIAIAMGEHGLLTRVLALRYPHALLSFAAPDPSGPAEGTAPGQVSVSAMLDAYRVRTITERTRLVGLLALDANTSPLLAEGNRWLARRGLDAVLVPLQPAPGENGPAAAKALHAVAPFAAMLDDPASAELIDVLGWLAERWQGEAFHG